MTGALDLDELERRCNELDEIGFGQRGTVALTAWELRALLALARPKPLPAEITGIIATLEGLAEEPSAVSVYAMAGAMLKARDAIERLQLAISVAAHGLAETMERAEAAEARCAAMQKVVEAARSVMKESAIVPMDGVTLDGDRQIGTRKWPRYEAAMRALSDALSPETGSAPS